MNQMMFKPPVPRSPTQAAEGLPRWRWTVDEIERLAAAGFFHEHDDFELIGGEIVPMSPKGRKHEIVRGELAYRMTRLAPADILVVSEAQLNLTDDTYVNPDILVHSRTIKTPDVRGPTALLVIEIADTSLQFDLRTKSAIYAAHGVREYWVVNARTMVTLVFARLRGATYDRPRRLRSGQKLSPTLVPELAIALGEIDPD